MIERGRTDNDEFERASEVADNDVQQQTTSADDLKRAVIDEHSRLIVELRDAEQKVEDLSVKIPVLYRLATVYGFRDELDIPAAERQP